MAIQIRRLTGAGPTGTDITSINTRLNAEDAHTTAGTDNPILKPSSGTNYSFWAVTRLYHDGAGTGTVNNIKWFTDGANGLGTGKGLIVATAGVYDQATGTEGTSGTQLTVANYGNGTTDLNAEPVNAFTYTSGSPLSVTGSATDPNNAYIGHMVVQQATVADTASAGVSGTETISFRYDSTLS
jgi:hypothetical protein